MLDPSQGFSFYKYKNMKIYELPSKQNLAHLRVQWFYNEDATRGKSQNVLKIRYRTKRGDYKEFIIPVSSNDQRNLRKKVRSVLGTEEVDLVMQHYKELSSECKAFFGFRLVCWKEGHLSKSKSDGLTPCWFKVYPDNTLKVSMVWAGEAIGVTLQPAKESSNPKAPIAIGYYNEEAELIENLKRAINDKSNSGSTSECKEGNIGQTDTNAVSSGQEVKGGTRSRASDAVGQEGSEDSGGRSICIGDAMASTDRKPEASSLGGDNQVSVARDVRKHEIKIEHPVGGNTAESVGRSDQSARKGNKRCMVDRNTWGVWQPEAIPCTSTGLGTTIRL